MAQIQFTVLIDSEIKDAIDEIKTNEGIPLAAQLRFALLTWLETRGKPIKTITRKSR